MCDCVSSLNAELKLQGQSVNANLIGKRQALISLIRTDKWAIENRRSKSQYIIAVFCPFCGEKYTPSDEQSKSEEPSHV